MAKRPGFDLDREIAVLTFAFYAIPVCVVVFLIVLVVTGRLYG